MEIATLIDESLSFENTSVRVLGTYNEPWFVAKDVTDILEIGNITEALRSLPENWKRFDTVPNPTGKKSMCTINEPGLYKLIMRSNKPVAQKFQDWICEDLLPTLRKKGEYNLKIELERRDQQLKDLSQANERLKQELADEQDETIRTKKVLYGVQTKFTVRHKFTEMPCVYIIFDPDGKFAKYKIGFSDNINERLRSDRTMVPNLQVKLILYTTHNKLFEKIIKIRYADFFETLSHEWIIYDGKKLIDGFMEIDKACGFNSLPELNLWKYNLEEKDQSEVLGNAPAKNLPIATQIINNAVDDFLSVPQLIRADYVKVNDNAPQGMRYCNYFCQTYRTVKEFTLNNAFPLTMCNNCLRMKEIAKVKLSKNEITLEDIQKNPEVIMLPKDHKMCKTCLQVLDDNMFEPKKLSCRKCRNKLRSKFHDKFDEVIEDQIQILQNLASVEEIHKKLQLYTKRELQKLCQYLELGRKYNENKQDIFIKIADHFTSLL
jgi:prophage antirepressor-like protein